MIVSNLARKNCDNSRRDNTKPPTRLLKNRKASQDKNSNCLVILYPQKLFEFSRTSPITPITITPTESLAR